MNIFAIFKPYEKYFWKWSGINLKKFPKEYDYNQCSNGDTGCYQDGVDEEMLQWNNFILILIANLVVTAISPYISAIAFAFAGLLYFFPGLATTPSNKIDPKDPTFKGIPVETILNSVKKIKNDPFNPVILFFEGYILLLDSCHSLAYLVEYMEEYFGFQQEQFPSVMYAGRNGADLANDLFDLGSALSIWKYVGIPGAAVTWMIAPFAVYFYFDDVVNALHFIL